MIFYSINKILSNYLNYLNYINFKYLHLQNKHINNISY